MNTKLSTTRTVTLFAGLALAGIAIAVSALVVPGDFAQTLMIAVGSAVFGSGLTFFLIRMSNLENK